jgi:IS30 family transposase
VELDQFGVNRFSLLISKLKENFESSKSLAESLNVAPSTVSRWTSIDEKKREHVIKDVNLVSIAGLLNKRPSQIIAYLVGGLELEDLFKESLNEEYRVEQLAERLLSISNQLESLKKEIHTCLEELSRNPQKMSLQEFEEKIQEKSAQDIKKILVEEYFRIAYQVFQEQEGRDILVECPDLSILLIA